MSIKLDRLISDYKARSADPIRDQQTAYIAKINDDIIECTMYFYSLQGVDHYIDQSKQILIKMNYMRFATTDYSKIKNYKFGIYKMVDLVSNKIIMPFAIFINGIFIPWDFISIITDGDMYYLLIEMDDTFPSFNTCINYDYIQYLDIPIHGTYSTTRPSSSNPSIYVLMSFDNSGLYTRTSPSYFISVRKDTCTYQYWNRVAAVDGLVMSENSDIKISESNIILFTNGLFTTGTIKPVNIGCISECTGKDNAIAKHLSYTTSGREVPTNPSIKVDSTVLTINGGKNPNKNSYDIILSMYNNYTDSMDIINKVNPSGLSGIIKSVNSGQNNEYLDMMRNPFDFTLENNKEDGQTYNSKTQNTSDVIKAIMEYDPSILTQALLGNSNMEIEEYTITNNSTDPVVLGIKTYGLLELVLDHKSGSDEYILVLVNGMLPDSIYESDYNMNKFTMPIRNIKNGDIIEVLRFKNINNKIYEDIVINEDDGFIYSKDIVKDNMKIFSTDDEHASFTYPEIDDVHHYPIKYTTEMNESGMIKIILDDPYYYGKKLSIAYDNRFAYVAGTYINNESIMIVDFTSKDFYFCDNYFRYMVFLNGRKLLSNHYRLVLPTRSTTPFHRFKIYLSIPLKRGDRLDIIYTPSLMKDIFINESISETGDIVIDKSFMDYGASSNLYMFWINGKKIPKSHLVDIDSTRMRIISNEQSINNLCVTKYIPNIDGLDTLFNDTTSLMDTITSKMEMEEINNVFGIRSAGITDTEANAYKDAIPIRAVMNELIRGEYVANDRVDITDSFVYGYEDIDCSVVISESETGTKFIESMDANQENNIIDSDIVTRPYP